MTILSVLVTIFGIIGGVANVPQAYKIFKRKSAKDISILTYSILQISVIIWLLYGIEIKNIPIIITNTFSTVTVGIVIIGWFMYGKDYKNKKNLNRKR